MLQDESKKQEIEPVSEGQNISLDIDSSDAKFEYLYPNLDDPAFNERITKKKEFYDTTKKKYYDFVQNIPLFLPISQIGNKFSEFLDQYPVTPYLDSRESFTKWMHFIHNKINVYIGLPEKTMEEAMVDYYEHYKPIEIKHEERNQHIKYVCGGSLFVILLGLCVYFYRF